MGVVDSRCCDPVGVVVTVGADIVGVVVTGVNTVDVNTMGVVVTGVATHWVLF